MASAIFAFVDYVRYRFQRGPYSPQKQTMVGFSQTNRLSKW